MVQRKLESFKRQKRRQNNLAKKEKDFLSQLMNMKWCKAISLLYSYLLKISTKKMYKKIVRTTQSAIKRRNLSKQTKWRSLIFQNCVRNSSTLRKIQRYILMLKSIKANNSKFILSIEHSFMLQFLLKLDNSTITTSENFVEKLDFIKKQMNKISFITKLTQNMYQRSLKQLKDQVIKPVYRYTGLKNEEHICRQLTHVCYHLREKDENVELFQPMISLYPQLWKKFMNIDFSSTQNIVNDNVFDVTQKTSKDQEFNDAIDDPEILNQLTVNLKKLNFTELEELDNAITDEFLDTNENREVAGPLGIIILRHTLIRECHVNCKKISNQEAIMLQNLIFSFTKHGTIYT